MSLQELLFDIHSVESDVLSANCDLSSLTYEMVTEHLLQLLSSRCCGGRSMRRCRATAAGAGAGPSWTRW